MDLLSQRLSQWEQELRDAHVANVVTAQTDPQKAGHAAEGIWVKVAKQILPPGYRVLTRKYMGTEVDIVILSPTAPAFFDGAEVTDIPRDVASAVIHVKNTLNRQELRDAVQRIHAAYPGTRDYKATRDRERLGLPSAIVALGSDWKNELDSARRAFVEILQTELVPTHPSQIPGFVGTPDWNIHNHSIDRPAGPPQWYQEYQLLDSRWQTDHVVTMIGAESFRPTIQSFAQWLFTVCATSDPSLESMRVALTQLFELGGSGSVIPFEAASVYSETRLGR